MVGKFIEYGNYVDLYTYEKEPSFKRKKEVVFYLDSEEVDVCNKKIKRLKWDESISYGRRINNINATSRHFTRLALNALKKNGRPLFVTFTFATDIKDVTAGYKLFRLAMQRFRNRYGSKFSYIAVPEWQPKSGRVHYHSLIWGLPDALGDVYSPAPNSKLIRVGIERKTRPLAKLWKHGFVDCRQTNGSDRLVVYLVKYIAKMFDNPLLIKLKIFTRSKNLGNYSVFKTQNVGIFFQYLLDDTCELTYDKTITTRYFGTITFKTYKRYG